MSAQPDRQQRAADNRERCPDAAKVIDAFREVFGGDINVVYVKEGDVELGHRIPKKS